jgi:membrane-associated phospholipid phosphatase
MASPVDDSLEAGDPASRLCWTAVACFVVATIVAYRTSGLAFDLAGGWRVWLLIAGLCLVAWIYRRRGPAPRLSHGMEVGAQLLSVMLLAMMITFPLAVLSASIPYRDDWLATADLALGFDWRALNAMVEAHPWLATVMMLAYVTMVPQFAVAIVALAVAGRLRRLQHLMLSVALCLTVTLGIFAVMPALGYHGHLGLPDAPPFVALLQALRSGAVGTVRLETLDGLISFPSFHTAAALMLAWAFWDLRLLRWPAIGINLLVVASTPVMGSHYLVDLIAGAALGAASVATARRLPTGRPSPAQSSGPSGFAFGSKSK